MKKDYTCALCGAEQDEAMHKQTQGAPCPCGGDFLPTEPISPARQLGIDAAKDTLAMLAQPEPGDYTCTTCGERMVFNVPRMGPDGGFVHATTGSYVCGAPTPAEVHTQMQASAEYSRALDLNERNQLVFLSSETLNTEDAEIACSAPMRDAYLKVCRELEQAKNDRNKAALQERQKYLPALANLRIALREARAALENVPCVGEVYDQQHADTHMQAVLDIHIALDAVTQPDR